MPRKTLDPTHQQWAILWFMAEYAKAHHNFPSTREIARERGISQPRTHVHLHALMDKGYIVMIDDKWRLVEGQYIPPDKVEFADGII
jgi:DNA-binding MarR family transcriptional regulator